MNFFFLIGVVLLAISSMLSCSVPQIDKVPLAEFQSAMDSIGRANGVKIWTAPNQYDAFGVYRSSFDRHKHWLAKTCTDTSTVYVVRMFNDDALTPRHRIGCDTLEAAIARYEREEKLRDDKKNRVTWQEFKSSVQSIDPDYSLISKKSWKKQRMIRSEFERALREVEAFNNISVASLSDSVGAARMDSMRHRFNRVYNGMVGSAVSDKPYVGLTFGAEGSRLSESETLWFNVSCWQCYPFPAKDVKYRIEKGARIVVNDHSGKEPKTIYINIVNHSFYLLQNPPFRYTFTASFEYDGHWYSVFMCEDPLKCVCKAV